MNRRRPTKPSLVGALAGVVVFVMLAAFVGAGFLMVGGLELGV